MPVFFMSICFCAYASYLKPVSNGKKDVAKRPAVRQITAFKIPQQIAPEVIDQTNHLIGLVVHAGIPVTALTPAITYAGSTITPGSGVSQDFTNTVVYTIDGLTSYSVSVLQAHSPTPICSGTSATITGDPPPAIPGTFRWQILNAATGAWSSAVGINTNPDYLTATLSSNVNAPKVYTFRRSITNALGTVYDSYSDITVNPKTPIAANQVTAPPTVAFCTSGDADIITGTPATGGDGVTYSYQWQQSINGGSFSNIAGATSVNYDPPASNVTTIYQRVVTSGACITPSVSNKVTITILNAITNNQIYNPATTFYCIRATPSIINGNIPSGGTGTFRYQWQNSTDGITFTDITGATRNDYNQPAFNVTTYFRRLAISGACSTPVYSNVVTIAIQPGLSNNSISTTGATAFCTSGSPGTIGGTQPFGGNGNYTYQWQRSPDGGTFSNIVPAVTTATYDPGTVTATTYYQRLVASGACSVPLKSNVITITVVPALAGNTITPPATTTFCAAGSPGPIPGSIPTGGNGIYTFVWQSSVNGGPFTDIPNSNVQNYDPQTITQTTVYKRGVTAGACNTPIYSNPVTITITPASSGNNITGNSITAPPTVVFCASGDADVITGGTAGGGNGINYNYQWQQSINGGSSFNSIAGATSVNYDPPASNITTIYQRIITSGTCTQPSVSNKVTITILNAITNNQIYNPATTFYCIRATPSIINGNIPSGGTGTFRYQWQNSTDGITFTDITGATRQDYNQPAFNVTTYFRRSAISGTCSIPVYSNVVTITIQPGLSNNSISTTGATAFCTSGSPGTIGGTQPFGGNGNYTYQWQRSPDGGTFSNIVPAVTTATYDPGTVTATTYYQRLVTSGACSVPLKSNVITITVVPALAGNTITAPATTTFCAAGSPGPIPGSIPTGGNGIYTFVWQSSVNGEPFTDIPNSNVQSYDPQTITQTTVYKRGVTAGACNTPIYSNPVTITINQALANNTLAPPLVSSFCQSGNAGVITGTPPSGGDGNYTYQWQQSPTGTAASFTNINGQAGPNFDPPPLTSTMFYRRVVTNSICTVPSVSNVIEIHITPPITSNAIAAPPLQFCESGDPEKITGNTIQGGDGGNSYNYQWYSSTNDGATWGLISGAIGIDYDPPAINITTSFRRDATSGACQVPFPSNVTKIVVNPTPANVSVGPVAPVCAGSMATISVLSPNPALTYNWYDTPAKGNIIFTGPTYTAGPLTGAQTFYVEASNGSCSSPALTIATVTVTPLPPAPTLITNPVSTCLGSAAVLNILNPQSAYTYNWYLTPLTGTPIFTGAEFTTPPVNNNITYYVEAVNNATGCVSFTPRTVVNVSAIAMPTVTAQGADVCAGETATLTTNNSDINVTIKWYTTPTGGSPVFTGNSFTTSPVNANTTYYAEASKNTCVSATRSVAKVQLIQPLATPIVSVDAAGVSTISFSWAAIAGATGYQVSIDGGQTFTSPSSGGSGTTHTVTGLQSGQSVTIMVRATGEVSCRLSNNSSPVTGTTTNPQSSEIFVANAFTPNGDGKNDIVYVLSENIKSVRFYVYDQWGSLLYTSQSKQNGWDGSFKGKTQPTGVYVYYLEAIMNDGKQVKKKGTITLLR